jgi:hypothetical protein
MKCREARRLISLLYDGRLDDSKKQRLDMHLKDCSKCRSHVELISGLLMPLEKMEPLEPREDGWEAIASQLKPQKTRPARHLVPAFGTALIIFCLAIALLKMHGGSDHQVATHPEHKSPVRQAEARKTLPISSDIDTNPALASKKPPMGKRLWTAKHVRHHKRSLPDVTERRFAQKPVNPEPPEMPGKAPAGQLDVSVAACDLITQGFSVLIEASEADESSEGGDTL